MKISASALSALVILFIIMASFEPRPSLANSFTITTFKVGDTVEASQVVQKLYEGLGHQVKIQELPSRRALVDSNDGKYDGELVRIKGTEQKYPNLIPIPTPIMQSKTVVITLQGSSISPKHWSELQGYRIAIPAGVQLLENRATEYGIQNVKVMNAQSILRMLQYKRIDLTIMPISMAKQYPELKQLRIVSPAIETVNLYHYVHKKNSHLVKALDKELQKVKQHIQ